MHYRSLSIRVETNEVPAPFAFECDISVAFARAGASITFSITYQFRKELTDEEIVEEGFTLNDDFSWNGELGDNWAIALRTALTKTTFRKKSNAASEMGTVVSLKAVDEQGNLTEGIPSETGMWDYLSQELIQAVFEAGGKEKPFRLKAVRIQPGRAKQLDLKASFSARDAEFTIGENAAVPVLWEQLRSYMKTFFVPDYLLEEASVKEPKGNGYYVQTEPGIWYQTRKSILNPTDTSKSVEKLEKLIDELIG